MCVVRPGDLDGDGFVGLADLDIVLGVWNQAVPPGNPLADPSGDGFVGLDDLDIVLGQCKACPPPGPDTGIVPEPASCLLVSGMLPVILRRGRRRAV